jgi:hypothetical protein
MEEKRESEFVTRFIEGELRRVSVEESGKIDEIIRKRWEVERREYEKRVDGEFVKKWADFTEPHQKTIEKVVERMKQNKEIVFAKLWNNVEDADYLFGSPLYTSRRDDLPKLYGDKGKNDKNCYFFNEYIIAPREGELWMPDNLQIFAMDLQPDIPWGGMRSHYEYAHTLWFPSCEIENKEGKTLLTKYILPSRKYFDNLCSLDLSATGEKFKRPYSSDFSVRHTLHQHADVTRLEQDYVPGLREKLNEWGEGHCFGAIQQAKLLGRKCEGRSKNVRFKTKSD